MLCVIGASREKGHEKADIPVHVFGPQGTCEFLSTMYDVSCVGGGWRVGAVSVCVCVKQGCVERSVVCERMVVVIAVTAP